MTTKTASLSSTRLHPRQLRGWGRFFLYAILLVHTVGSVLCIPLSLLLADVWSARPGTSPYFLIVAVAQAYLWMGTGMLLMPLLAWLHERRAPLIGVVATIVVGLLAITAMAGSSIGLVTVHSFAFAVSVWLWHRTLGRSGIAWAIVGGLPGLPIALMVWTRR